MVEHSLWERGAVGSNPIIPIPLSISMEKITLQYLEDNFDNIFDQVESGKSFHIMTPDGRDVVIIPNEKAIENAISGGLATELDDSYFDSFNDHDDGP